MISPPNSPAQLSSRKPLLKWSAGFFCSNVLLYWLIGLCYLFVTLPLPAYGITHTQAYKVIAFIIVSIIGHLGLLALLPLFIIVPLILLFPHRKLIFTLTSLVVITNLTLLTFDAILYGHYHLHLNGIIFKMFFSSANKEIFVLSWLEWLWISGLLALLISIEIMLGIFIWRKFIIKKNKLPFISISSFILASLLFSYYSLAAAMADNFYPLTRQSLILPFYNNVLLSLVPIQNGLYALETMDGFCYAQPPQPQQTLQYPLHSLVFQPHKQPLNIIIIVIDTWRFDMLNTDVTPNLYRFAQTAWQFTQHSSGGNCTQPGIFSLFYSIPASYWTAMTDQHQCPVLMTELKQQHYQFGVFASAELTLPAFNKNVFYNVEHLKLTTPGATPFDRDRAITQEFQQFINNKNQQPFFSFLFYDGAHSYCDDGNSIHGFQPEASVCNRLLLNSHSNPKLYFNRYKNALVFVDNLIEQDLNVLAQHDLLKNTVIIITGDHGNEFNDNHNNSWEHSSNYTHYQIQTPLIVYWPQQKPKIMTYITNHYQIVPTLMENALGCKNPTSDYSVERSLLQPQASPFLLAASYFNYGIIEHDRLTTLFPTGNYAIYNLQAQALPTAKIRPNIISAAFNEMKEYYKIRGL